MRRGREWLAVRLAACLACLACALAVPMQLQHAPAAAYACPPAVALRVCEASCDSDEDCPGRLACCATACGGTACVRRVAAATRSRAQRPAQDKPGSCPEAQPHDPWVCSSRCTDDWDCAGQSKCCRNRCGALACVTITSAVP